MTLQCAMVSLVMGSLLTRGHLRPHIFEGILEQDDVVDTMFRVTDIILLPRSSVDEYDPDPSMALP